MKKLFIAVVCLASLSALIAGKIHWDQKIKEAAVDALLEGSPVEAEAKELASSETTPVNVDTLTANLPEDLAEKIQAKLASKETIKFVVVGSKAVSEGEQGWPALLQQQLDTAYGEDVFDIVVKSYGDDHSVTVVQNQKQYEIAALQPDILLLEPFTLNDTGAVESENNQQSIEAIVYAVKQSSPDAVIFLQPPNPAYNVLYYSAQVAVLEAYAAEKGYYYLNHWASWPKPDSEELLQYIHKEDDTPNEKGHQLWADYLGNYFLSK
ncbi:SGNH/GDSL hydrolase family protein [Bacillus taeanensis]|uniref:SGNH/GDSL hydrolase family protein n=1 Tax=Bacillus taeanensis TaxID=273032 RepID=UPI0015F0A66D|nr:SGNH/GDSL hydrolase family protein [Bacillus taeanensis]